MLINLPVYPYTKIYGQRITSHQAYGSSGYNVPYFNQILNDVLSEWSYSAGNYARFTAKYDKRVVIQAICATNNSQAGACILRFQHYNVGGTLLQEYVSTRNLESSSSVRIFLCIEFSLLKGEYVNITEWVQNSATEGLQYSNDTYMSIIEGARP